MRYKMIISYDGSFFHGFQRQKGYNSVQETMEKVFSEITKTPIVIKSAGRTDAGVHAIGQVIHFDSIQEIPPKNFRKIANKKLYPHIYVKDVEVVNETFHSRVSAIKKKYHYLVDIGEFCPLNANYRHYFHNHIDIDKIKEAMKYIEGTHDFKSFSKNHIIKNTIRTIESFTLDVTDTLLTFKIIGNGFMHNMVRIIIAVMLKVGEGKFEPTEVINIIDKANRSAAPYVAPAAGLYLYKVYYK